MDSNGQLASELKAFTLRTRGNGHPSPTVRLQLDIMALQQMTPLGCHDGEALNLCRTHVNDVSFRVLILVHIRLLPK